MKAFVKLYCICCLYLFFLFPKIAHCQDFNFSLFNQNKTYYNPAFTGLHQGQVNGNFVYRKQWLNFPGEFATKHLNIDWKSHSSNGFGIFVISDLAGESFLRTNSFGANYSWRGTLDKYTGAFFQLGLRASYNEKKIDIEKLTFSDQLNEIYGKIYGSSFVVDQNKCNYIDFSIGTLIHFNTLTRRSGIFTHTIGFALHHFTRPIESFQGAKVKIPLKLTAHAQSQYKTTIFSFNRKDKFRISPWLLYENKGGIFQNGESENNLMCGFDFNSDPITGGVAYKSHLSKSANYNSLVFKFGTRIYTDNHKLVYRLFYSYDLAINNYTKYTRDSHEIGLSVDIYFKRAYKCINQF